MHTCNANEFPITPVCQLNKTQKSQPQKVSADSTDDQLCFQPQPLQTSRCLSFGEERAGTPVLKHAALQGGEELTTGSLFSQIKFPAYMQLPGKSEFYSAFSERNKTCCLERRICSFYGAQLQACRHLGWAGTGAQCSCEPTWPQPFVQATSGHVCFMVFQLVPFATFFILFHDEWRRKVRAYISLSTSYSHSFAADVSTGGFSTTS